MTKELNKNIILDKQGMSFSTTSIEQGKITLLVNHDYANLDLMLFYKTISGDESGVFSNHYRDNKSDLGSYDNFPYICLTGDIRPDSDVHEEIRFRNIDNSILEMYILIIDYESTLDDKPVDFTSFDCALVIQYNKDNCVEIPVNCSTKGYIYEICRFKKEENEINIINESKCISLGEAHNFIPGFNLICSK